MQIIGSPNEGMGIWSPNLQVLRLRHMRRDWEESMTFIPIDDGIRKIEHRVAHTNEAFDLHTTEVKYNVPKKFQNYQKCLDATMLRLMQKIVTFDPGEPVDDHTEENSWSQTRISSTKSETISIWIIHIWIDSIIEPRRLLPWNPGFFCFCVKEILACSLKLSGTFQKLNDPKEKMMMFGVFPLNYHLKFQEAGKIIEKEIMESIVDYFQMLHEVEEAHGGVKKENKKKKHGKNDDDG